MLRVVWVGVEDRSAGVVEVMGADRGRKVGGGGAFASVLGRWLRN